MPYPGRGGHLRNRAEHGPRLVCYGSFATHPRGAAASGWTGRAGGNYPRFALKGAGSGGFDGASTQAMMHPGRNGHFASMG